MDADGEAFGEENRAKQHHVLVAAPTLDGVVGPSHLQLQLLFVPALLSPVWLSGQVIMRLDIRWFQLSEFLGEGSCTWWRRNGWLVAG